MNRRPLYSTSSDILSITTNSDPLRELFEACKAGDLAKVKKLVNVQTVNARDTAGRKSTPLHFAAGKFLYQLQNTLVIFDFVIDQIIFRYYASDD